MKPKSRLDLKKARVRAFFSSLEGRELTEEERNSQVQEVIDEGMVYKQMRLPVSKTEEIEKKLKEKIEHKIISANIRDAKEDDLNIIREIYNQAWLTSNTPFRPIDLDSLEKIYDDPDTIFLIGKVYARDAGFVIIDLEGDNKQYAVIAALGVIPRFQRRGFGTILGVAAWNYIKEHFSNIEELRCEVYKDNNVSYSFISQIGFEEFGTKVYRREDFEFDND
ncbi:MAG: GNAT family N-acetyltransferase [Promethearchaeota archaeon]|nr:MAG: GNAT family N-acetyltransferase [Candidatus Lokiarchaeota archaeon]